MDQISDEQLVGQLRELLKTEGRCEARVVAHLAEVDARRIALKRAQSLFEYCQKQLGFSDSQAYYRIAAARVASRFPVVFEMLERREIHVVNVAPLSKHLTAENHRELLEQAGRLSKRQLLECLAQRYPKPDVVNGVRRLPPQPGAFSAGPTGSLEPTYAASYRLQLNTSQTLKEKLELARDLMSHANPSGDLSVVVERALDLLIDKLKARRFGATKRPRQTPAAGAPLERRDRSLVAPGLLAASARGSEDNSNLHRSKHSARQSEGNGRTGKLSRQRAARPHISNETRRTVVGRDGLRCSFVGSDGCRCTARAFLELDHRHPLGRGGPDTPGNLRVFCRAHNQLGAELAYGKDYIQEAIQHERST